MSGSMRKTVAGHAARLSARRELHYIAKSLLFSIPAISIGVQIATWTIFVLGGFTDRLDFGAFYRSGLILRTGHVADLYALNPPTFDFIHPAYEALLFVPLSY